MAADCGLVLARGSINDGVDKGMSSLLYTSVDVIASKVLALGQGPC